MSPMSEELHTGETNNNDILPSLAENLIEENNENKNNNNQDENEDDGDEDGANKISFMTEVDMFETQYFELEGTQVEVEPGYVLAQTYKGVFKVEHDSEFSTDNSGRLFVTNRNGHISELGVDD